MPNLSAISLAFTTLRDCSWIKIADTRSMRFIGPKLNKNAVPLYNNCYFALMNADDDKIITFESYYDPMLAHIVRSRLEANGIPCFIADENIIGANPLYNNAVGGIKLKVFEKDVERCREILATEGDLHEDDHFEIDNEENTYVVCPFCASTNINHIEKEDNPGMLDTIMNLANPFYSQKNWHCNNCLQDFE